ncbi:MAG: phage holin family protein [Acidimicrobiia bacterium]
MPFILRTLISAAAVWVAVVVVSGLDWDGSIWQLLLIGLIVGLVNALVKPLATLLSLPLLILTLGLFLLVINWLMFAIVVWLAAPDRLDLGLTSADGLSTFLGSIVVTLVSWGLTVITPDGR